MNVTEKEATSLLATAKAKVLEHLYTREARFFWRNDRKEEQK